MNEHGPKRGLASGTGSADRYKNLVTEGWRTSMQNRMLPSVYSALHVEVMLKNNAWTRLCFLK